MMNFTTTRHSIRGASYHCKEAYSRWPVARLRETLENLGFEGEGTKATLVARLRELQAASEVAPAAAVSSDGIGGAAPGADSPPPPTAVPIDVVSGAPSLPATVVHITKATLVDAIQAVLPALDKSQANFGTLRKNLVQRLGTTDAALEPWRVEIGEIAGAMLAEPSQGTKHHFPWRRMFTGCWSHTELQGLKAPKTMDKKSFGELVLSTAAVEFKVSKDKGKRARLNNLKP